MCHMRSHTPTEVRGLQGAGDLGESLLVLNELENTLRLLKQVTKRKQKPEETTV